MRTSQATRKLTGLMVSCSLVLCLGFGCSTGDEPFGVPRTRQVATPETQAGSSITPERLFGKYVVTDYAWCLGTPPQQAEAWAKGCLHNEAAILPEVFAVRGVVVRNPRYEIRHFPKSVEGEVPTGVRRLLSDFYGAGTERAAITRVEVYEAGAAHPRCGVEVIDENTLWETWDRPWLFEWRREGTGGNPIALKKRALGNPDR
ncbi:MAG: hypothetical protein AMS16_05405 [Planctomycetes bacterium DG_58]|nr:MAG: hypothetical protein AMS16_05405 [Planctomycetes bacterium DG_58]